MHGKVKAEILAGKPHRTNPFPSHWQFCIKRLLQCDLIYGRSGALGWGSGKRRVAHALRSGLSFVMRRCDAVWRKGALCQLPVPLWQSANPKSNPPPPSEETRWSTWRHDVALLLHVRRDNASARLVDGAKEPWNSPDGVILCLRLALCLSTIPTMVQNVFSLSGSKAVIERDGQ